MRFTLWLRYLPSYIKQIHSFPHLVLVTGMLANCSLFIQLLLTWKYWEEEKHAPWDYTATWMHQFFMDLIGLPAVHPNSTSECSESLTEVVIASMIFGLVSLQLLHMELVQYSDLCWEQKKQGGKTGRRRKHQNIHGGPRNSY